MQSFLLPEVSGAGVFELQSQYSKEAVNSRSNASLTMQVSAFRALRSRLPCSALLAGLC